MDPAKLNKDKKKKHNQTGRHPAGGSRIRIESQVREVCSLYDSGCLRIRPS